MGRRREAARALAERCPRCGARHRPSQRYCLECGLPLPLRDGALPALRAGWVRRLGWYPGDFLWRTLAALLVAGAGAGAALALGEWRAGSHPRTLVAPTPATLPAPQALVAAPGKTRWPPGEDGWTVVLASSPASAGTRPARALALRAAANGLPEVGVLRSAAYASLPPGYYVIFSGVYGAEGDAETALRSVQARGYGAAYPVEVAS